MMFDLTIIYINTIYPLLTQEWIIYKHYYEQNLIFSTLA